MTADLVPDDDPPPSPADLDAAAATIEEWARRELASNPVVDAVERDPSGDRRWYIRVHGEEKDVFAIWLVLLQRSLHYETYLMPGPEENAEELYRHLLVRNQGLVGAAFTIGPEDAVYLRGTIPVASVDPPALDHILGLLYATTEQCFRPAMRIGFASRFRG